MPALQIFSSSTQNGHLLRDNKLKSIAEMQNFIETIPKNLQKEPMLSNYNSLWPYDSYFNPQNNSQTLDNVYNINILENYHQVDNDFWFNGHSMGE